MIQGVEVVADVEIDDDSKVSSKYSHGQVYVYYQLFVFRILW